MVTDRRPPFSCFFEDAAELAILVNKNSVGEAEAGPNLHDG